MRIEYHILNLGRCGICWMDWDMSRRWFELVELYLSPRLICICRLILSRICRLIETPDMILRPPDARPRVSGCCIYLPRTQKHVCPNHQPSLIRARYNLPIFNVHRVVCVPSRPFQRTRGRLLCISSIHFFPTTLTDESETLKRVVAIKTMAP